MVDLTAATILNQNGYTQYDPVEEEGDFTYTVVENIIDDCIDTVNSLAGSSIGAMTGVAEAKTVTITRSQAPAVKFLVSMVLRETKKTSLTNSSTTSGAESVASSSSLGPASVSESSGLSTAIGASSAINNPANSILVGLFYQLVDRLRGRSMERYR